MEDLATRVAALEHLVQQIARSTQQPLLDLIEWCSKEQVHDLGRTRGALLALEAGIRALVACRAAPERFEAELRARLAEAEASVVTLQLPDRSLDAAAEGLREAGDGLIRAMQASPRAEGQ